jgi:hypothetical protein
MGKIIIGFIIVVLFAIGLLVFVAGDLLDCRAARIEAGELPSDGGIGEVIIGAVILAAFISVPCYLIGTSRE